MSVGRGIAGAGRRADDLRFAQLYERYYGPIRDFCARRVPRDTVDDAVADTFLTVWRCLDEVPAGEAALVWVYGVAHRVVGHQRRSLSRRGRLHERLRTVEFRPAAPPTTPWSTASSPVASSPRWPGSATPTPTSCAW